MISLDQEILCGITYGQILECEGMSQKAAAEKLGVNHAYFNRTVHRIGIVHLFPKPKQQFTQCVSAEDIAQAASEGYTMKDAAFVLGVSERYFKELIARWKLTKHFPNSGKAAHIGKVGYCK